MAFSDNIPERLAKEAKGYLNDFIQQQSLTARIL